MAPAKPRPPLPPGPFLVAGLARSGEAAARLLAGRGETVLGIDSAHPEGAEGLRALGVEIHLDGHGSELVERAGSVIKSPGVPGAAAPIARAESLGIPVIGELELAWRLLPNRFVAVTGTNGKTTVAELLGHVWQTAGEPVAVAGNVGTPLTALVDELDPAATVVCEASSFQLEDSTAFAPECAILLNLAADHLDRHGSLDAYREAKLRIFANQAEGDFALINRADPELADLELPGAGREIDYAASVGEFEFSLAGPHNAENAAAAATGAAAMGIDPAAIAQALRSFGGVPNRLEPVAERDGVAFVNDSKATNPAAAAAALESFDGPVHAILGGSLKGGGFAELVEPVISNCRACYLIGTAAASLERDLAPAWAAGVECVHSGDLASAVGAAAAAARGGETVVLAPACASFDVYTDYEQRGEHFRELVRGLG